MEIRKAKIKDLDALAKMGVELLRYHEKLDPYFAPSKDIGDVYRTFFKRCIHSANRHLLVAESEGKLIGYACGNIGKRPPVFKYRKFGMITDIYLNPAHRRKRIAKQFLSALFNWFKSKGLTFAELSVHSKNDIGLQAWAKHGFEGYTIKQRITL